MRGTTCLLVLALASLGPAFAGEGFSPEALLPTANGKDAYAPTAAFGGDAFLVAWQSGLAMDGDILACRIDRSGRLLDAEPLMLSSARDVQERPRVAYGGGVWLVVWQDLRNGKDYDVHAARVDRDGKCLEPGGFPVAGGEHNQVSPRVAFDGRAFTAVWEDFRSGVSYDIYCAHVSPEGKIGNPGGFPVAEAGKATRQCMMPAVVPAGGGKSLVLWTYGRGYPNPGRTKTFQGAFVGAGKVTEAFSVQPPRGKPDPKNFAQSGMSLGVAAGPKGHLVAWRNWAPCGRNQGGPSPQANAVMLDAQGKPGTPFFLRGTMHRIMDPDVAWDGSAYVAVWHEQRAQRKEIPYDRVFAIRIGAGGRPAGGEIAVAGSYEAPARAAAVASYGKGTTLIAYERHPKTADVPIKIGFRMLRAK